MTQRTISDGSTPSPRSSSQTPCWWLGRPSDARQSAPSALEGTFAPAADVLSSEIDADIPRSHAVTEVLNFIHATEHGIERLNELPISTRLACELQRTLIAGTPSEDWQTGKVRQTQVLIGPYKGCSVLRRHTSRRLQAMS